jgi:hypothetical protein
MEKISHKPDFNGVFNDERLDKRAATISALLMASRNSSIKGITKNEAEQKGFYRFLENENVSEQQLVLEMQQRCSTNTKGREVIAIQDSSSIGLSEKRNRLKEESGIGLVGNKEGLGFLVHTTLVLDAQSETMLGFSAMQLWHRKEDKANNTTGKYKRQPIEEKESYKWIEASKQSKEVLSAAKSITIVEDREGDIYEQFCLIPDSKTHLVIRNRDNRKLADNNKLHDYLQQQESSGSYALKIAGDIRKGRINRIATIEVRYARVTIAKPQGVKNKTIANQLELYAVEAKEIGASKQDKIKWRLLTTHVVDSFESACNVIRIYQQRWYIEQVFRLLKKQGFRIESSELSTGWAIRKLTVLLLNNILRIMQLLLAYENEESQRIEEVFSEKEISCLKEVGIKTIPQHRYEQSKLAWASDIIARLGGWKGNPRQRPPGPITMKRGLVAFAMIYKGWCIAKDVSTR